MILCVSISVIFGTMNGMELKVGLISKLPMNYTHRTCVCNAQACHKRGVIDLFHSSHFEMKW